MTFGIIGHGRFGKLWADTLRSFGDVHVFDKNDELIDWKIVPGKETDTKGK